MLRLNITMSLDGLVARLERLGDAVESTELHGGHLATAEQPRRLAELIEGLR
jgi:hypothetical protein